jgi:hypothetical protein
MVTEDNAATQAAVQYFATLHPELGPGERIELRRKAPTAGGPMRQTFVPSVDEAATYAVSFGNTWDVYSGVATRLGHDGTKAGVCRVTAVWADLDAKDGHTREGRLEQLLALSHHPSILVWTGGGWHAYYLLTTPAEGAEEMGRAELVMRRLAAGLDSDPVHDRGRILRVPGTFNHKYGEPRPVVLERLDPGLRYGLDQLQEMAETLQDANDDGITSRGRVAHDVLGEPIREHRRNLSLTSVAGSLRDRGLDAETILIVLSEVNRLRCVPPLAGEEVHRITHSVCRYPAGRPRYLRSSAMRTHTKKER